MNILKNLKKKDIRTARSNAMLLLIALICAIASWFIIAMTKYTAESKHISNIPLVTDISATAAKNGLSVIKCSADHVSVSLDCSRTDYSRIRSDTLRAYVDYKNISSADTYELSVRVETTNGAEISNVKISPATVTVELDKYETKAIVLKAKVPNISGGENRVINSADITCEPGEVNIKGPAAQLANIAECYAVSDEKMTIDTTTSINSDRYLLLSEDGTEIAQSSLITFDPPVVNMSIPVMTQKTVKFVTQIVGAPTDFDTSCLSFTITPETAVIATKNTETRLPDTLDLKLRLSDLDIGFSKDIAIENLLMGTNITNLSDTDTVNISLNSEGLASKDITISNNDIHTTNAPSESYDYTVLNQNIMVKLIGPSDVINEITPADLDAYVNLLGADDSMDQFPYPVTVSCNKYKNIWSVTSTTVNIKKTPKEGASTTQTTAGSATVTTKTN